MSKDDSSPRDVVLPLGPTEDGGGVKVLRARDERVEVGEVRPLEEGKPIHHEVVKLAPRKDAPWLCDVEVTFAPKSPPGSSSEHKGPAQVATPAYRDHWDKVFGPKSKAPN